MIPIGDDNSSRRTIPVITWLLVISNIFVFLLELAGGERFITLWSFNPARFSQDPVGNFITIFTSMFVHAGWMHLLGNMLYLIILVIMLKIASAFPVSGFLPLCGLLPSGAIHRAPYLSIPTMGHQGDCRCTGHTWCASRDGGARMVVAWIIKLPALVVIGSWILVQLLNGLGSLNAMAGSAGGVAYMAHIGGFAGGFLLSYLFRGKVRELPP